MSNQTLYTGKVESWDKRAGFGYIIPHAAELSNRLLLFHCRSVRKLGTVLQKGDRVRFKTENIPRGILAIDVCLDIDEDVDPPYNLSDADDVGMISAKHTSSISLTKSEDILARAILARDGRQYDEAVKLYETGLRNCPTKQLVLSYAAMERNRNRSNEAMSVYEKGIKLYPDSAKLREDAGMLAASIHDYSKALRLLKEALSICRTSKQAGEKGVLLALARTLNRRGMTADLRESLDYYLQAIKVFGGTKQFPRSDLLDMNLAKIRLQHFRGDLTFKFIRNLGFAIMDANLMQMITVGADLIINIDDDELRDSYGLYGQTLARIMFKTNISFDDIDDLTAKIDSLGTTSIVDDQVVFIVVSSLSDNLSKALYRRIEEKKSAIIPIQQSEIESQPDSISVFRAILDRWLFRRDLFAQNAPVMGRRFFGRSKPLSELQHAIATGTAVGVFGLRKVGKTSLLKELERRSYENGDIVVYTDLLRLPADVQDARWLYWKLANELYDQARRHQSMKITWRLGGTYASYLDIPEHFPIATAFDADVTNLLRSVRMSKATPRPRVVLLFDEIERLLPTSLGKQHFVGFFDFFSYLRGVTQESSDFAVVITAANAAISETSQFEGRDNPVFNFFKEVYLQLLEKDECATMLKALGRGMGIRFTDVVCENIYRLTGGHPFFTRHLASFLAARYPVRPLTLQQDMINGVINHYLEFSSPNYQEIIDRFSRDYPREKDVCIKIARVGGTVSIEELAKNTREIEVNLRHLEGYQMVRFIEGRVSMTMELMRMWLNRGVAHE